MKKMGGVLQEGLTKHSPMAARVDATTFTADAVYATTFAYDADAAFIVRCAYSHDALVAALKAARYFVNDVAKFGDAVMLDEAANCLSDIDAALRLSGETP